MVSEAVCCLNQFPHKNSVSSTMSATRIVVGTGMPDYNAMRIELGAYVQVLEDFNLQYNTCPIFGAIALSLTGNAQGNFYFMSLATGSRLS
jgi:hypothetical protein